MFWLGTLDAELFSTINSYAGRNEAADRLMRAAAGQHIVKGVVPALLFWCLWFVPSLSDLRGRLKLITLLVVAFSAIAVGRIFALTLPFRYRPIHEDGLEVRGPLAGDDLLDGWSSFPSDHAVLYFALAAGFLVVSRPAGLIAMLHAALIVSVPRVYLGLHYPSDLFGGALIGMLLGFTLVPLLSRWEPPLRPLDIMIERFPFVLYPAMFFVTFQLATMFEGVRRGASMMFDLIFS